MIEPALIEENMLVFLRALRAFGFSIGAEEEAAALAALAAVGLDEEAVCRFAVRAVVAKRADEFVMFDALWRQFLRTLRGPSLPFLAENTLAAHVARLRAQRWQRPQVVWLGAKGPAERDEGRPDPQEDDQVQVNWRRGASRQETLRQTDFARLTETELRELARWSGAVSGPMRLSRRWRPDRRQRRIDPARTLRSSLGHGEVLRWLYAARAVVPRPVVMLCDVSGSMEPYSRALLSFAHVLLQRRVPLEVFVFSTRLSRITRELRQHSPNRALADAMARIPDFAGGTRLTEALAEFRRQYARRMLQRGAYVLLVTDGFEATASEPEGATAGPSQRGLVGELAWLRGWTRQLIWLNPLAADSAYRPATAAAQALLRVCQAVRPAGNWADLEQAWEWIAKA
ncbi:MAG: VWA domain-containing protein [Alicyclobacillus shizuokensis]|nr:VWA domain-containing protein [Alicyclobacillus shizuokensis]